MLRRRPICLISLVLIMALAGYVQAVDIDFVNAGDGLWSNVANWKLAAGAPATALPTAADWAKISNQSSIHQYAIINNGFNAVALKTHVGYAGGGTLTVNGGTLTNANNAPGVDGDLLLGKNGGSGTLNMISGTINCRDLEVGGGNPGILNMTGGVINVARDFDIPETSGSEAEVHLDGGIIYVGNSLTMGATGLMDITDGTLILPGDKRSVIQGYFDNGWITAYHGSGVLNVDFDTINSGKTTVTAAMPAELPAKAANPTPSNGSEASTGTLLSWIPGSGAASHDVYFGTSSPGTFQGNQSGATTFNPGILIADTVYYWRIDEKNALGTTTGDVWNFTARAANSEIIIVPSGTGDDTTLIQTTLNGLQNGDTLRLNGNFVIGRTIYLPSHFTWILTGSLTLKNNAVLDRVGWVAPGIDARRRTGISEKPGGATNIDMSGGTYYGNYAGNSSSLRFINFVSVTNSKFHDMVITDVSDDNFTLGPGCNNNECRNLTGSFSAGGNALTDKGDHNTWYDCVAEDCYGPDSDGWTPKCRYSEFHRCIARRNVGPGFGMFCRIDGSGNPVDLGEAIVGNKFYDCQSYENGGAGFSFNISSTSGEGGSITNNYVQAICYNNASSGVRFRNKMPNSIVADNEINLLCYGNQGRNKDGTLSALEGGLGTDASSSYPVTRITGSMVSFDNIQWDVNLGTATNCSITAYHPDGENAPVLKTGGASNSITVIDFNCSVQPDQWCVQKYCELFVCAGLADFNCNGIVDMADLLYMAGVWLTDDTKADISLPADGIVNLLDLSILSLEWLQ